jgi:alpha-2-macroglobulin
MFKRSLAALFGNFTWTAPSWFRRTVAVVRSHRIESFFLFLCLLLLLSGGWWTWRWYQRQPKPYRVAVSVDPIPITALEKDLHPAPLNIHFDTSVARLDQTGKILAHGVQMKPATEGTWTWSSDSRLTFTPKNDWPAEQTYRITLDKELFPRRVLLARHEVEITTPAFAGEIKDLEFYQDPKEPSVQQVTATVEFSHSVKRGDLERHIALSMLGGSSVFKTNANSSSFTITYGLHDRVAYLRTVPLTLPEREDFMKLFVGKGIVTTQGSARSKADIESKIRIPDVKSFFKIEKTEGQVVRNNDDEPEQILLITTTAAAKSEELQKALHLFLLPKRTDVAAPVSPAESDDDSDSTDEEQNAMQPDSDFGGYWSSPREIDPEVLKRAKAVRVTLVPSEHEQSKVHTFKFQVEASGSLYLKIDKGVIALGGFPLGEKYDTVIRVPVLPREIEIQGRGGVLALNGERKLSIKSRGVGAIEYELARVATSQINHLITQSGGRFDHPQFSYNFNEENISRLALEHQSINLQNQFKANFSSFDFSSHLQLPADGGSERGLFFIRAHQWDEAKQRPIRSVCDRRFILVTDIGMLVKKNADASSDVFIVSIKSGQPLAQVAVEVLGKNGVAVARNTSGPDGRVSFPSFDKAAREKTPVAFVARLGDDVAFMPFARADRRLDFSRFDIDGVESASAERLEAFLFTERGVYRPGDEVHIGYIVKQRNWSGQLAGLPLEIEVIDARGLRAQLRKVALPSAGFDELNFQTAYESPTGEYRINLYLLHNGWRDLLLGNAIFQVKEFLPDRMRITSELSKQTARGWIDSKDVRALVTLRNLYGTPATQRRLTSHMDLSPAAFHFAEFKDYIFHDPLRDGEKEIRSHTIDLGEQKTDGDGKATVKLGLERFADATYEMTLCTQGFEAEGGRSVSVYNSVLVSSLPRVIGYKADAALDYIPKDRPHAIEFIALDSSLNKIAVEKLQFDLIEQSYVSILAKKENGNYAYESVLKERSLKSEVVTITPDGLRYPIATDTPGNFLLEVRDDASRRVSQVHFCVVGLGNVSRSLEKNSELQVKLDRQQYKAGDEIEVSITAPYTGSGLITIESDKVRAHQWFKSDTTSSLQRVRVPDGFDGTGYINVSFVRGLDSKEIFMSPLSYAVVPFTVNKEKRRLHVELQTSEIAKPGEPFKIGYKTDRPAKIVVFAVDQGILQVTNFSTPDPLGYFFRKTALEVETSQIVDLIMPEFSILRATPAAGGDGDAEKRLNPFKRVTEKPVVFWSGVIDADATEREIVYQVPDYFDGTLTVMAVAVAADAAGSTAKDSIIRGPFVITPSMPTVAAPGDRFEVGVTVANNVAGSGENAEIALTAEPSSHLEIIKSPDQPLHIAEGRETAVTFTVRAKEQLGSATLNFHAFTSGGQESTRHATLSVRPAVPFMTQVRSGNFTNGKIELPIERVMHAEFRQLEATVSALPLGLARGLDFYLKNFPHGCTEQISSASFSRLLLADEADFGLTRAEVDAQLEKTFATLRRRQNDQGAFGYWSAQTGEGSGFISVYATHFLVESKAAGFAPPNDILKGALRNLQGMVAREPRSLADARTLAYAAYVLTREGVITTNYVLNLRDYLDKNFAQKWQSDLIGVYLAGSWAMLKNDDEARRLIRFYRLGQQDAQERCDFYQELGADSQYIAIVARHFPDLVAKLSSEDLRAITKPIGDGEFNTLSAAYAVWALKTYSQHVAQNPPELNIIEIARDRKQASLPLDGKLVRRAPFLPESQALRFTAKPSPPGLGAYYQVVEAGFDRQLPTQAIEHGLEIYREFVDASGKIIETARLGEPITVRLHIRSLDRESVTNVAITDLLPGGFEIVDRSLTPGVGQAGCDYVEVREDRAVFFGSVSATARTISYQIKPCNRGEFVVPPPCAELMYERGINARGMASMITVVDAR